MPDEDAPSAPPQEPTEPQPAPAPWGRTPLDLAPWQWAALGVATVIFAAIWLLTAFWILDVQFTRVIAGVVAFVGAGMRFAAHGQRQPNWQFVDLAGKLSAYYGAFTFLFLLNSN